MPITLWFYFGRRFVALAAPLFAVIFFLIYAADLIELLRRGANSAQATAGGLAYLALLRAPPAESGHRGADGSSIVRSATAWPRLVPPCLSE